MSLGDWLARRTYGPTALDAVELAARKTSTVSVIVPARETASTIGTVVAVLAELREVGLVDEVLVVDAASSDGTAALAAAAGARVEQEGELLAQYGPCLGKGDAMWRGASATVGELVVYVDADTEDFHAGFVTGLLAPVFADPALQMVKGTFARPFKVGDSVVPHGGGRVTELAARPLLNLHRPQLAGFVQPLAGEVVFRRGLLEALPFPVGYGVEIANLIDAADLVGIDALGQADLGERQNRHQDLRALSAMAYAVLVAASRRVLGPGAVEALSPGPLALPYGGALELRDVPLQERPPLRAR